MGQGVSRQEPDEVTRRAKDEGTRAVANASEVQIPSALGFGCIPQRISEISTRRSHRFFIMSLSSVPVYESKPPKAHKCALLCYIRVHQFKNVVCCRSPLLCGGACKGAYSQVNTMLGRRLGVCRAHALRHFVVCRFMNKRKNGGCAGT